ncbi:ATP-binding protein [Myxococcus faecalis]|uniref:AAA family ATPase n=1 Tax=Myxococcus faecalis TaxID=3115646 RepID=UPI003CF8827B
MFERLELHHVGPAPEIVFDFTRRLNLITGDNGVGKTFILDVAWWALTRSWAGHPAAPHRGHGIKPRIAFQLEGKRKPVNYSSEFDFKAQSWALKGGRPPDPGLVLYARIDGSFSVWDPTRNHWPSAHALGMDAPDRPAAYLFAPQDVWNGLKPEGKFLCNGLIADWASWQGRGNEAYQQLCQALIALSPSESERLVPGDLTRISLEDVRDIPTLRTSYGQEVPVVYASAGVRRIISLAYLLVWTWQEHLQASRLMNQEPTRSITFLIDEVEAHLHPRWQRTILRSILQTMSALTGAGNVDVQVLAVTHSPLLLASLEPLFDIHQDSLWNLNLQDGAVVLRREPWQRRGDANSWLVSEIFDLREPRSLEAEQAMQRAETLMEQSSKGVSFEAFIQVRDALRASLPDVDPFWMRWRFWAREAGLEK